MAGAVSSVASAPVVESCSVGETGTGTTGCSRVTGSSARHRRPRHPRSWSRRRHRPLGRRGAGDRAAHDLAGGPRGDLAGEVARAGGALVVVEGEAADGVEVARDTGGDLGGRGDATGHARRAGEAGPAGAERPEAGQPGIREGHDTHGVAAGGVLGLGAVLTGAHGGGLEATQAHVAVGGAQHVVGLEVEVVHAALAGGLQGRGDLAGDPPHLVAGHATVGDQLGERAGLAEVLLDDVGDVVVAPDVEDAHEDDVGDRGGTAGGVEQGRGAVVVARDAEHRDGATEGRVVGGPAFGAVQLFEPPANGVTATEDGAGTHTPHRCSSPSSGHDVRTPPTTRDQRVCAHSRHWRLSPGAAAA